jgi:hypothetical protein
MADGSQTTPSHDSAIAPNGLDDCRICGGDGFVLSPTLDACPRCSVIAEAEWRMTARKQQTTNNICKRNAA